MTHFAYVPFTGLGLFRGFRGNHWLKNRITVFKQFVVPSLQAQTNQNFKLWISWRPEERNNPQVKSLHNYLADLFGKDRVVFTYHGVCFWDDKYSDSEAHERLITALHHSIADLLEPIGDVDDVVMTIQPSDDCYHSGMVEEIQALFTNTDYQALGYQRGYIMSYQTKEVREYNPDTNPPFFSIKFPKATFIDPFKHLKYTGPYKSHEYVGDTLKYLQIPSKRGFLVGTHGENISTHFNIPYAGDAHEGVMHGFEWIAMVKPLKIRYSLRKWLMRKLPHRIQRKLRYWFGELLLNKIYAK